MNKSELISAMAAEGGFVKGRFKKSIGCIYCIGNKSIKGR